MMPYPLPHLQPSHTWRIRTAVSPMKLKNKKNKHSGLEYHTLQLDIGLPRKNTPDSYILCVQVCMASHLQMLKHQPSRLYTTTIPSAS